MISFKFRRPGAAARGIAAAALAAACTFGPAQANVEGSRAVAAPDGSVRVHAALRPQARDFYIPSTRWEDEPEGAVWTRTLMSQF